MIDGNAISEGDEIAVFTPSGTCAGVAVWTGNNLGITAWGDDIISETEVEGFLVDETIHFRIWDASASQEYGGNYGAVLVSYVTGNPVLNGSGEYASNGIYEIATLGAFQAPAPPSLLSPANGAIGITMPLSLGWSPVSGAHSYDVQVATDANFRSPEVQNTGVIGTASAITGLSGNQTYYWRVRSVSSAGIPGPYSSPFSFTTLSGAPAVPALTLPEDGSVHVSVSPTLDWESVSKADTYELQVSTADDFSSVDVLDKSGITSTSESLSGLVGGVTHYWRVRAQNAEGASRWSPAFSFTTIAAQTIALSDGWNMVSSRVEPLNSDIDAVLLSISSSLVLVKDGIGGIYWPDQGLNSINAWDVRGAYIIYLTQAASLTLSGTAVKADETSIPLSAGWNSTAYWGETAVSVTQAMQSVSDAVVAVKNIGGEIYLPGEGIDMINALQPGAGYMIFVSRDAELTYPASTSKSSGAASQSTGLAASATVVVEAPMMTDADVIIARSGSQEIGRAAVSDGRAILILKGDDPLTETIDGAREGDRLTLAAASGLVEKTLAISETRSILSAGTSDGSDLIFKENAIWRVHAASADAPTEYELAANYPNPFNPSTTIEYALTEPGRTRLSIYNMLGQRVAVLVDNYQEAGRYDVRFDAAGLPSGSYVYRLESGDFSKHRQMVLTK